MIHVREALSRRSLDSHRVVIDTDPICLQAAIIPTRVPGFMNKREPKLLHVAMAIVIKYNADESNGVRISRESNTASVHPANDSIVTLFRGVATFVLKDSHRMQYYKELLVLSLEDQDASDESDESYNFCAGLACCFKSDAYAPVAVSVAIKALLDEFTKSDPTLDTEEYQPFTVPSGCYNKDTKSF